MIEEVYRTAHRKYRYNGKLFLEMVGRDGGLQAAKNLLASAAPQYGFTRIVGARRTRFNYGTSGTSGEVAEPLFSSRTRRSGETAPRTRDKTSRGQGSVHQPCLYDTCLSAVEDAFIARSRSRTLPRTMKWNISGLLVERPDGFVCYNLKIESSKTSFINFKGSPAFGLARFPYDIDQSLRERGRSNRKRIAAPARVAPSKDGARDLGQMFGV